MRRVRRPEDKEDLLLRVINGNPFSTYREALIFCAALGYAHGRRTPFEKTKDPIPWEVFSAAPGIVLVDMLAATTDDDLSILGEDEEGQDHRLTIFEEYANGGLEVLRERLESESRPEPDIVLDLVLGAEEGRADGDSVDLTAIADELGG